MHFGRSMEFYLHPIGFYGCFLMWLIRVSWVLPGCDVRPSTQKQEPSVHPDYTLFAGYPASDPSRHLFGWSQMISFFSYLHAAAMIVFRC